MIKLEEHIVEIEGIKYVPLHIAQTAQSESFSTSQLDEAMKLIKTSINDINKSVNDSLKDD